MLQKIGMLVLLVAFLVGCQFSETMVLNEDGSGRMKITMDMSEMMAMLPTDDTTMVAMDSIVSFKQLFESKKDSISQLPQAEQERLKLLENYQMRMVMNPETSKMVYEIFTDFKSVAEANSLMEGLSTTENMNFSPSGGTTKDPKENEPVVQATGVKFSFENNVFKRDGFIKDEEAYNKQMDSIQQLEAFMSGSLYRLEYTFPKRIKNVSLDDAEISNDGKTVTFQQKFITYMKNPDALDMVIELEDN